MNKSGLTKVSNNMLLIVNGSQEDYIRALLQDREFAMLETTDFKECHCGIRDVGSNKGFKDCDYYLCMNSSRYDRFFNDRIKRSLVKHSKVILDASVKIKVDMEEVLSFFKNKELVFKPSFFDMKGDYEASFVNQMLKEYSLLYSDYKDYLYDDTYDIRVYLREISENSANKKLTPTSPKDFDITRDIVKKLRVLSKERLFDDTDFFFEYDTVQDEIKGHYFLARFHGDLVDFDIPICLLNFRISVFILPGAFNPKEVDQKSKDIVVSENDGKQYKLDSIHFTSDVCYDLASFYGLMEGFFYGVKKVKE